MYLLSDIHILNNTFMENGPVTTFSEVQYSPYYKYFAMGSRKITLNVDACQGIYNYTNEFDYFDHCYHVVNFIDMPPLEGAIHITHCHNGNLCHSPTTLEYGQALLE